MEYIDSDAVYVTYILKGKMPLVIFQTGFDRICKWRFIDFEEKKFEFFPN